MGRRTLSPLGGQRTDAWAGAGAGWGAGAGAGAGADTGADTGASAVSASPRSARPRSASPSPLLRTSPSLNAAGCMPGAGVGDVTSLAGTRFGSFPPRALRSSGDFRLKIFTRTTSQA